MVRLCRRPQVYSAALMCLALTLVASPGLAARAMPLEGTVLVRLVGNIRVLRGADERVWREQLLDLRQVELGTGSGVIVSPQGWIVTNHHVVRSERFTVVYRGQQLDVSIDVVRIEVVLPLTPGEPPRQLTASVYAADPDLDIAILYVGAADLPYVGLGDSDALAAGEPVNAVGYPFGGVLELAAADAVNAVPTPSMSAGTISALRLDAAGDRRLLQLSAPLNPGNSGGPIVDAEGYIIGIAQARVENANAIGLAIPINRVKQFIQSHGLEAHLPVELVNLGAFISNETKGVSLRVPTDFEDRSPGRLRVEASRTSGSAATSAPLALRIDRVATTQSLEVLERALTSTGTFERFQMSDKPHRFTPPNATAGRVLAGYVSGSDASGHPAKLVYALVDLGKEKLVARYLGDADIVAANRSPLLVSLLELDARALLSAEITRAVQPRWRRASSPDREVEILTVEGWVVEPAVPWPCAKGLPPPSGGFAMAPTGDFTVVLRAAWFAGSQADVTALARHCSQAPGELGPRSYTARAEAWGIAYQVDGVFVEVANAGVWQLEMIAPADKTRFVAPVFADWTKAVVR
jgi:hypothetical protein